MTALILIHTDSDQYCFSWLHIHVAYRTIRLSARHWAAGFTTKSSFFLYKKHLYCREKSYLGESWFLGYKIDIAKEKSFMQRPILAASFLMTAIITFGVGARFEVRI